jgi:membrane protease subunit HflK
MADNDIFDVNRWGTHVPHMSRLPRASSPLWRAGVGIVLAIVLLATTFYQVQPEAVGVVLRFGRYVRTTDPGLHMKVPFAEEVIRVPVQRQLKQEFGFRTEEAGVRTQYAQGNFNDESMMLTGDLNVAIVEWIVQYRVSDPYQYLFKVRNPDATFRAMNEAVMRQVVGDRTVTEVLTVGRQEIETRVETELQAMAKQYELGITLDQVVLQDVNPPNPVKPSWDAVNQAQQQRDRLINEARAEYNKVVPRAKGEAEQAILQAQGYALDRVNRSQGDSARFKAVYDSYRKAPEVTRRRMYLETMGRVLPNLGGKVFLDKDVKGILPLLPLQNMMGETTKNGGGM